MPNRQIAASVLSHISFLRPPVDLTLIRESLQRSGNARGPNPKALLDLTGRPPYLIKGIDKCGIINHKRSHRVHLM
jgi:hypothetical protein